MKNNFNDGYPDDYDFGQHLHNLDFVDDGLGEYEAVNTGLEEYLLSLND